MANLKLISECLEEKRGAAEAIEKMIEALKKKQKAKQKNHQTQVTFAKEIQQAIIDVLIKKTIKAAKDYRVKTIILGGGVSANSELRKQFLLKIRKEIPNTQYLTPNTHLSTDNGLMVAVAGYFHRKEKISGQALEARPNLRVE